MKHKRLAALIPVALLLQLPSLLAAEQSFFVKPLSEKKVSDLPAGDLFWIIDNFATKEQAQAAAGPFGLVAEAGNKVWLFTLGPTAEHSTSGKRVAKIGPIPPVNATEYLLRVNEAGGPPNSFTPVHTHPGSEAFYVVTGELTQKTPHGVVRVAAGESMVGHGADTPMQVSNSGSTDLYEFALFVVDASKPFSSPAQFP
jgi:quercetin dioxygenase-like cupin family protein